ncbi:integrase_H2C2 domain-containing protein [Trichonephila clavipes]|nr:integrase_H2C2 domain-containing protein [Trichonephila clavipes]
MMKESPRLKRKKCCLKCLEPNHIAKFCKQFVRCLACGKAHSVILCPGMGSKMESPTGRSVVNNLQIITVRQICTREVALMTLWVRIAGIKRHKNEQTAPKQIYLLTVIAMVKFLQDRKENGRYCVGLPWLGSSVELPSNFQVEEKRLFGIPRKLRSLHKYEEYDGVFKEWLEEGVIEMVPDRELTFKGHYLPHHQAFKPDSVTIKIRPVFDASCKVGRSTFLNDCLVKGSNLIEEIPSILLRSREKCSGVTSDIQRTFLQIE